MTISRRRFVQGCAASLAVAPCLRLPLTKNAFAKGNAGGRRLIILGMDGVEPALIERFVGEGTLPNFLRVMQRTGLRRLQTTLPPQSPVAWSSFATGTRPSGHGIFDFIHRDARTMIPYLSTSKAEGTSKKVNVGNWSIPLSSGSINLMRRGVAFWDLLEANGVPCTIFALPANFPVVPQGSVRATSGMGTPDLLGGYGTFTFFSETPVPGSETFTGGRVVRVTMRDHKTQAVLEGPPNEFRNDGTKTSVDVTLTRDPWKDSVEIEIGGEKVLLQKGEWSSWVPVRFSLLSMFYSIAGMVRFYVKNVHPRLQIYASPINVDPMEPTMPIASPPDFSVELAEKAGRFYTQGFPADQKGLSHGVLTDEEYFAQAKIVLDENFAILDVLLSQFDDGLLFFYFSSIDQNCHMLWRLCDPTHPQYRPDAPPELKESIKYFYRRMDEALGKTLEKVDSRTRLVVLSDHGFTPFTREFHANTWLHDAGILRGNAPLEKGPGDLFSLVDWDNTRAYGLGFNGIYLNLKGREPNGVVDPADADREIATIIEGLQKVVDPVSGQRVIRTAFNGRKEYVGPYAGLAPDIVMGFNTGYRTSDDSVLGKLPLGIVGDRTDKWAADHCYDPATVPGILLSNDPVREGPVAIWDLAPSILQTFGVAVPPEMEGGDIFLKA